jgi:hypothetical protein
MQTATSGGASDTLKNAETVMPAAVEPTRVVTTLTPLGHCPSAILNCPVDTATTASIF